MSNQDYNTYTWIHSIYAAGVTVSSDPCVLKAIIVNNITTAYTIGIVDSATTTNVTANVAILKPTVTGSYLYNCEMGAGLRIVLAKYNGYGPVITPDITVVTRR